MFERWAILFADLIKRINPDETDSVEVLVFGFTIIFNLLFTFLLLFITGFLLDHLFILLQVAVSFMVLRMLTGGAHLDHSLACSLTSILIILAFSFFPISSILIYTYLIIIVLLVIIYAPYYEPHQVTHSKEWEFKKKQLAYLWLALSLLFFHFFHQPGLILGALLQSLLLTPYGINFISKINILTLKGGDNHEKNS
ncbi:accessory gene regulator B family protein [Salipaludibacillus neizhouensis]|nr:accessory gene regulator B family protein [Salipaludibacillus neizhouensis]